ncbi:cobalamin biosynthesis protein CobW [Lachnoclostridium sp. An14]|uniref:CobW family GTP-binding protein n=1 Tax=Lachnoclostridium sp. An14 TaxID=1965562 RepID=UPI000B36B2E3|nr:CobW family GTP-binding protein [Lachnoclostridium sp. An14]OUQ21482.1 cobalamin biosynthesis protein CobW [Lachnoclostridium sp. An14]
MTKIDIISGFLGAGKTTFIKKLLEEAIAGEQVVLIENEFGEIGIDGGFLKDSGIEIREMNSGCICCSLVGDFGKSLEEVLTKYQPDRVIIEPSGVGKLSDVMKAVRDVAANLEVALNSAVTVVDASKCKMYMKNFGEFFNNQVAYAGTIILSRTDVADAKKVDAAVKMLREANPKAVIVTTPVSQLTGSQLLEIIEKPDTMEEELMKEALEAFEESHHHHEHGESCGCGHEHHDHDHDHEHHHEHGESCEHGHDHHDHDHDHHHEHGESCEHGHDHHDHDHDHHHEHGESCGCGHDHHEHGHDHDHHHEHGDSCGCGHDHHHHHADEVFSSWGMENVPAMDRKELEAILDELAYGADFGDVLRAKGMLPSADGEWLYFDLVPEEYEIRTGAPTYTGKVCVIGANLKETELENVFGRS